MAFLKGWQSYLIGFTHFMNIFISSVSWLSFTPIAYATANEFNCSLSDVNNLSAVFLLFTLIIGPFAIVIIEKFGLNKSLLISTWFILLGTLLRTISAFDVIYSDGESKLNYRWMMVGQSIVAMALPLSLFSTTKTTEMYFTEGSQSTVNTFITLGTLTGLIFVGAVAPRFATANSFSMFIMLPFIWSCFNTLGETALLYYYGKSEKQDSKESVRSGSILADLKIIVTNKSACVLIFVVGGGLGLISSLAILIEQLLCPLGYDEVIAGYSVTTLTAAGILGAFVMAIVGDMSQQYSLVIKMAFTWVTFGLSFFCWIMWHNIGNKIAIVFGLIGIFVIGILPTGILLAVESCYPAGVSLVTGIIQLIGNLQGMIFTVVIPKLGKKMSKEYATLVGSVCKPVGSSSEFNGGLDMSVPVSVLTIYVTFLCCLLLFCFKPKYKRRQNVRLNERKMFLSFGTMRTDVSVGGRSEQNFLSSL